MAPVINVGTEMFIMNCGECGILFGVDNYFDSRRRKDGRDFFCPNGHPRVYRETEFDRITKERDQAKAEAERQRLAAVDARCEAQGQRLKAERLERKLKRVRNGVCPECKRSFGNLREHMTVKHPACVARAK